MSSAQPSQDPPFPDIDRALETLAARAPVWARVGVEERARLLEGVADGLVQVAQEWVAEALRVQRIDASGPYAGENWFLGPAACLRYVRELIGALREISRFGRTRIRPEGVGRRPNGQLTVQVQPEGLWERAIPFRGQAWLEHGVDRDSLADLLARGYREPAEGGVALVLGAGNVTAIPFRDTLHQLFAEHRVAILKLHPATSWVRPFFERALAPLTAGGFVRIVQGDVAEGAYLTAHELVSAVHMTGSDTTHDAIVWGPRAGQAARKAARDPVLTKPMSSELGNVTPIIVVPGPWTDSELDYQAEHIAAMATMNAAFICVSGKVLVMPADWDRRDALLSRIRSKLAALPPRYAWYPGATARWSGFMTAHPEAEVLNGEQQGAVPWTLIPGLDPEHTADPCFRTEPFCGVLSEVPLPGRTAQDFLARAVPFCNDVLFGTLGANVLIHPSTRKQAPEAFDAALDALRYGGIAVNTWVGINYYLSRLSWGAFPGHPLDNVVSGRGKVHGTAFLDRVERSAVFGPFQTPIRPPYFHAHRNAVRTFRALVGFERRPSLRTSMRVAAAALRG